MQRFNSRVGPAQSNPGGPVPFTPSKPVCMNCGDSLAGATPHFLYPDCIRSLRRQVEEWKKRAEPAAPPALGQLGGADNLDDFARAVYPQRAEEVKATSAPAPSSIKAAPCHAAPSQAEREAFEALDASTPSSGGIRAKAFTLPGGHGPNRRLVKLEDAEALERDLAWAGSIAKGLEQELAAARQEQQILEGKLKVERQEQQRDYDDMRRFQAKFIEVDQQYRHLIKGLRELCQGLYVNASPRVWDVADEIKALLPPTNQEDQCP